MKTNPNDSAFNENGKLEYNDYTKTHYRQNVGLTKREYFAVLAMQGLLSTMNASNGSMFPDSQGMKELASSASVKYADALIKELNKKEGE